MKIAAALDDWRRSSGLHGDRTVEANASRCALLVEQLGDVDLGELGDRDLEAFASKLIERGYSGWTIAGALSVLRTVYNRALGEGLAPTRSPGFARVMRTARLRTVHESESRAAWSADEVGTLLEVARSARPHIYPLLVFLLGTGVRRGEALGLEWGDLDFEAARFHVRRVPRDGSGLTTKPPKTGPRTVPLSPDVAGVLRDMTRRPGRVFGSPRGGVWRERNAQRMWSEVRNLAAGQGVRRMVLYSTRHTYITLALSSFMAPREVAERVGSSEATIWRHYAHAMPSRTRDDFTVLPPLMGERR